MARKINVVMDPKPMIQKPDETEKVPYRPTYLPKMPQEENDDGIDYESIEERESELDGIITDFVCELLSADSPDERDMISFSLQDELEVMKDEIEEVLANHGIAIYRPTIIEDEDGNETIVDSLYE